METLLSDHTIYYIENIEKCLCTVRTHTYQMGHRGLLGRQTGTGDWRSILSCIYHIGAVVDPDLRKSETAKKFSIREGKYEKKR